VPAPTKKFKYKLALLSLVNAPVVSAGKVIVLYSQVEADEIV